MRFLTKTISGCWVYINIFPAKIERSRLNIAMLRGSTRKKCYCIVNLYTDVIVVGDSITCSLRKGL